MDRCECGLFQMDQEASETVSKSHIPQHLIQLDDLGNPPSSNQSLGLPKRSQRPRSYSTPTGPSSTPLPPPPNPYPPYPFVDIEDNLPQLPSRRKLSYPLSEPDERKKIEASKPPVMCESVDDGRTDSDSDSSSSSTVPQHLPFRHSSSINSTINGIPKSRVGCSSATGKYVMLPLPSSNLCDACPNCLDVCSSPSCPTCSKKLHTFYNSHPSSLSPPPSSLKITSNKSTYTLCEIRRHNHLASCWIIIKSRVYDVTDFLESHPGGVKSLLKYGGGVKDCEEDMMFHSYKAREIMERYRIGKVGECGGGGGEEKCCVM
ncbi:hypothetical protein TrVE_jg3006 [Triparma verrucosa]|uniref:Cytochrome b5 heme-binding domain-containing protein n=1 Tax=Triparma verrucosa TaxID=1606542 RepID=A0A9W7FJT7_9STRA|nr:hypothetical protein TrVE_jg3006 [Triparma verrucosa]